MNNKMYKVTARSEHGSKIETLTDNPKQVIEELGTGFEIQVEVVHMSREEYENETMNELLMLFCQDAIDDSWLITPTTNNLRFH